MKCLRPVRYYRDDKGNVSHNPNNVKVAAEGFRPCQYCINCRLRRAESNAIRMVHESQFHSQNSFITLTYDDDHLPPNSNLRYDDVSDWLKRLRRRLDKTSYKNSLSLYRVGEYGGETSRPHYHMVLFGFDFRDTSIKYKGIQNAVTQSSKTDDRVYYKSTFATDSWANGFVDIGNVDYSTCLYTAKYVTKKLYGRDAYGELESERSSSSKGFKYPKFIRKPKNHPSYNIIPHPLAGLRTSYPIGHRWIEKYYRDVYPHDFIVHSGKKLQPPRYYDDWLAINHPKLFSEVKRKREDNSISMYPDWRDLHAKHIIRVQRQSQFLRDGCAPNLDVDFEMIERTNSTLQDIAKGLL